jgi:hypothetical protein
MNEPSQTVQDPADVAQRLAEELAVEADPTDHPPESFAPTWLPEPEERFRFVYKHEDERVGDYGPYPIHTVILVPGHRARVKDGWAESGEEVAVHAGRDQLQVKFRNAHFEPGDIGAVVYDGPPLGSAKGERYRVAKRTGEGEWIEILYDDDDATPGSDVPVDATGLPDTDEGAARPVESTITAERAATRQLHRPLDGDPGPEQGRPEPDPGMAPDDDAVAFS